MTSSENTFFFFSAMKNDGGTVTEVRIFFPQPSFPSLQIRSCFNVYAGAFL